MKTVSLKKSEKEYQKIMKHQLLIPFFLLLIVFVSSCTEEIYLETEKIPIEDYLGMETFSFEDKADSTHRDLLTNVVIVNSIEQLKHPFETWGLEVPKVIEQFDYKNYSFLLRFKIELKGITDIKHELTHNKKTGLYTYYLTAIVSSEEVERSDIIFFYTGILVRKISDKSEVKAVSTITAPNLSWQ
jgi:hypothetical protein